MAKVKCPECGGTLWDVYADDGIAQCRNCWTERPYRTRKPKAGTTPSQDQAIARIRSFFLSFDRDGMPLEQDETTQEHGLTFYNVETAGNVYTRRGAFFQIGRHGKITILNVKDFGATENDTISFYAQMLKAHKAAWA